VRFLTASRLLVVAGKGGVGKTTVTATTALAAARLGLRVLVIEVQTGSGLAGMLGHDGDLEYDEALLETGLGPEGTGELRARVITPDHALVDYLEDKGLRRLSNRLVRHGVLEMVATAAPGIDDLLVLGKVKQLERGGTADLLVLDAPAAGHARTFLQSARGLADAVRAGPINAQARDVLELLGDAERCRVMLVTLAEETPVNELVDTAFALEDRVGVALAPVVVNALYPEMPGLAEAAAATAELDGPDWAVLAAAAAFRLERLRLQHEQLDRLADRLPLPQLHLPLQLAAGVGPGEVRALAADFVEQIERVPG
jgi:anion-transporting  ArsA/GET3 family ATPase